MNKPNADDLPRAPWGVSAAYLYTLDLDGPAVAWEYLRRNPRYRADWARRRRIASFTRWGLRCCRRPVAGRARGTSAVARID